MAGIAAVLAEIRRIAAGIAIGIAVHTYAIFAGPHGSILVNGAMLHMTIDAGRRNFQKFRIVFFEETSAKLLGFSGVY